ncbi:hypothetical protein JQN72_02925 [Phycicoccus sp. CSK15P-2]|nr:hypothetical protein [Phycicoccus sp. CSK15P-2]
MYSRVGLPAPLHATAVGKVLLAELPTRHRDALVDGIDFHAHTDRTITDPAAYRAELDAVRERGWAEDAAEHESFVNCVAAPVHDTDGRVLAAVSVSVPDVILPHDDVVALLPQVLEATAAIAADWAAHDQP